MAAIAKPVWKPKANLNFPQAPQMADEEHNPNNDPDNGPQQNASDAAQTPIVAMDNLGEQAISQSTEQLSPSIPKPTHQPLQQPKKHHLLSPKLLEKQTNVNLKVAFSVGVISTKIPEVEEPALAHSDSKGSGHSL